MSKRPAAEPRAKRDAREAPADGGRFTKTLLSVLVVQVVTLYLLWLLQSRFTH